MKAESLFQDTLFWRRGLLLSGAPYCKNQAVGFCNQHLSGRRSVITGKPALMDAGWCSWRWVWSVPLRETASFLRGTRIRRPRWGCMHKNRLLSRIIRASELLPYPYGWGGSLRTGGL